MHLCEVDQRACVRVQHVGLCGERDGLARQSFGLIVLAAPREHLAMHLAPQHLREGLLARGGLAPTFEPLLGLVVSAELERSPAAAARSAASARPDNTASGPCPAS
jgi:hypothetical protein